LRWHGYLGRVAERGRNGERHPALPGRPGEGAPAVGSFRAERSARETGGDRMNSFLRCVAAVLALCAAAPALAQGAEEKDNIAGPYVPTPWVIVDELLKRARIGGEGRVRGR